MNARLPQLLSLPHDAKPVNVRSDTLGRVLWFASEMEHKLSLNRHKGDRAGWMACNQHELLMRLRQEVEELVDALNSNDATGVIEESADVANFALMIADIAQNSKTNETARVKESAS